MLSITMVIALCACGNSKPEGTSKEEEKEAADWTREGYFEDENGNMLSVTWMELEGELSDDDGWYVGFMNGEDAVEDSYGGMVEQKGSDLQGTLTSGGEKGDITVTVSEEGEDGLVLVVEGGETYHFTPMDMPEATIIVHINTEGYGNIAYTEGDTPPEIDTEYPYQSAQINLAEPTVHTFTAWANEGWKFVKWTKDGVDFSTEETITLELAESADYIAVFEAEDAAAEEGSATEEDGQNPVMNFVGEYVCDRANMVVEAEGADSAKITLTWAGSYKEQSVWVMSGKFDTDTLTVEYSNSVNSIRTYKDDGTVESEEVQYENGTGKIIFDSEANTLTWTDDQTRMPEPMVFEFAQN